jgi:hypothetical protein
MGLWEFPIYPKLSTPFIFWSLMIQALIFDFDGLLIDTETPEVQTGRSSMLVTGRNSRLMNGCVPWSAQPLPTLTRWRVKYTPEFEEIGC